MLGMSSWTPVVSGAAALGAFLVVEIAHHRGCVKRLRLVAGALAGLALLGLLIAALGW